MKRFLRLFAGLLVFVLVAGACAYFLLRGPSPDEILASIDRPEAPVLAPDQAMTQFRVAPGFRVELVAAEPLVVDPVAMDWDEEGRLYIVEMRGFMPDVLGTSEDQPVGRVVVLEDADGDGAMDSSRVFADGLVLPRAIRVLPEGVLIGEPPNLWRCRDTTGDGRCDEKIRLGDYATEGPNVEHQENGLLAGIDGWLYNAKSERRLRLAEGGETLEVEPTPFRGQWGIAQDDEGLLYYNHNSGFLYGEVFPGEYTLRQAATAARSQKPGVNVPLSEGEQVWGIRVAPGLNRAYASGTLRDDGRQDGPTAVSGLAIQRGDQYGEAYKGDAFVPESGGNAVAHFAVSRSGVELASEHRRSPDEDWEEREFLASTDERFRPVDARVGPDGALWVIDMYRGVIQHAYYVSDYLRDYVEANDLATPGAYGRIWRIVREDQPIRRVSPPLATLDQQLDALDHPNGWVRDRAQRRLIFDSDPAAISRLQGLSPKTVLGRVHALWTLERLGALDEASWQAGLSDSDPRVRRAALRAGESLLEATDVGPRRARLVEALALGDGSAPADEDAAVRLQALHSLAQSSLPIDATLMARLNALARSGSELERQAVLSGLDGVELAALRSELRAGDGGSADSETRLAWVAQLAGGVHRAAQQSDIPAAAAAALLDVIAAEEEALQVAMLEGIAAAQRFPGANRVVLDSAHAIFETDATGASAAALARVRPHLTWPGDPSPGGARALTEAEEALRQRGEALFASSCASCHGSSGVGQTGLAPSLVNSPWVRNADAWLVRIALHGLTGPVEIEGTTWNSTMPGHGSDSRFDDEGLAGVLTFMRRAWGHGDGPVSVETVRAIREAESARRSPWTVAELRALEVRHRLDRYVGEYKVPMIPVSLFIERQEDQLAVGRGDGATQELVELGLHAFSADGISAVFEIDASGDVTGARVDAQGTALTVSRVVSD